MVRPRSAFELAVRFHRDGLPLWEAFAFASGLYFRGKIAYAKRFVRRSGLIRVITTNAGLVDPDSIITPKDLKDFGMSTIDPTDARYHGPLRRDAAELARQLAPGGQAILLGSIATAKYRDLLLQDFGDRLVFPVDFVGRGDMSRGSLLLRAAAAGKELSYEPVGTSVLKGRRAPRVSPRSR